MGLMGGAHVQLCRAAGPGPSQGAPQPEHARAGNHGACAPAPRACAAARALSARGRGLVGAAAREEMPTALPRSRAAPRPRHAQPLPAMLLTPFLLAPAAAPRARIPSPCLLPRASAPEKMKHSLRCLDTVQRGASGGLLLLMDSSWMDGCCCPRPSPARRGARQGSTGSASGAGGEGAQARGSRGARPCGATWRARQSQCALLRRKGPAACHSCLRRKGLLPSLLSLRKGRQGEGKERPQRKLSGPGFFRGKRERKVLKGNTWAGNFSVGKRKGKTFPEVMPCPSGRNFLEMLVVS